ncbi:MAG: transposase [Actinomycetales bacterium]
MVLAEMADWQGRPLDAIYPVVFIDAMVVKIRDGMVANRPVYCAIARYRSEREQGHPGPGGCGAGGQGSKFWQQVPS